MFKTHAVSENTPHNFVSEQYRKLRTNIDFSNLNEHLQVLNVTSALPEEGKTITAVNLAVVYSQANLKTLIIDMDLRKPKIHRAFHAKNKNGITDYVTGNLDYKEAIIHAREYLDILVAGETVPFPSEIFLSDKLKSLIEELKSDYDRIIVDCPPMTAVTDATIISSMCDGTIFIVASRNTNSEVAKGCIHELQNNGATVIGAVLTKVQKRDQYYGKTYNYYYAGN